MSARKVRNTERPARGSAQEDDRTCKACDQLLIGTFSDAANRRGGRAPLFRRYVADAAANKSAAWMPIVGYACGHWLHLTCVRNLFTLPISDRCGVCIGEMANAGQFGSFLQRLNGALETTELFQEESGDVVEGITCGINTGCNPTVDQCGRVSVESALEQRREQRAESARDMAADSASFAKVYQTMERALAVESQLDTETDDGAPGDRTEELVIRNFFSLPDETLWKFTQQHGGTLQMLIDRGATWQQLCQWGLSELQNGPSRNSLHWFGMPELDVLCRPPICMSFPMFFRNVCNDQFEVVEKLNLTEEQFINMGFSFKSHNALVLLNPRGAIRALMRVKPDTLIRFLDFTPRVSKQLKLLKDPALDALLRLKFTEWQSF